MMTIKTSLFSKELLLSVRGLAYRGEVQDYIDRQVLIHCEPYIPKKTGNLIRSGSANGGNVSWRTAYAKKQYYTNAGRGLRGARWFSRMWADRGSEILKGARSVVNDSRKRNIVSKAMPAFERRDILRRLLRF